MRLLRFVLFLALTGFPAALGSNCASADELEYQDRGNRHEGRHSREIDAPPLEPLSFIKTPPSLGSLKAAVNLYLFFFWPEAALIKIRAHELIPVKDYFMSVDQQEWQPGNNRFGPWELDEVIRPLAVDLTNIGIIGEQPEHRFGMPVLVPLMVHQHPDPASERPLFYEFWFKVKYRVAEGRFSVASFSNDFFIEQQIGAFAGGVPVSLRFSLAERPAGWFQLTLDCRYAGRRGLPPLSYIFYHQPHTR